MHGLVTTGGERLGLDIQLPWVDTLVRDGLAGELERGELAEASIRVVVESRSTPFDTAGFAPLTRGARRRGAAVVIDNVGASGFDLLVLLDDGRPELRFRWRPPLRDRAAALVLRSRFLLLAREVLLQYPVLWWAGVRGRAPLHAPACTLGASTPLLAGPGGVGKSTLLATALREGSTATSDNLAVTDGHTVWGVVEPLRTEGGTGRRMSHGRRESPLARRVPSLVPDTVAVLARGTGEDFAIEQCPPELASRELVCGTYMAGELRRYWGFAATLAAGTGLGPSHPPVQAVADALVTRLGCHTVTLPAHPAARLDGLRIPLEARS